MNPKTGCGLRPPLVPVEFFPAGIQRLDELFNEFRQPLRVLFFGDHRAEPSPVFFVNIHVMIKASALPIHEVEPYEDRFVTN